MTTTRHTISALMQVDPAYWRNTSDVPVWADSVQDAVQWIPNDATMTVTKVLNATSGRYELRLDWSTPGIPYAIHQLATVPGKYYRLVASVYTDMPKMSAWVTYDGPLAGSNVAPRELSGTPMEVWGVFAATATTTFLQIGSPSPLFTGSPAAGRVFVTQVALYEVQSTTYVDLHPVHASVRLDSEWSPYVRVDLTCPLPAADALARIDPRGVDSSGLLKSVPARAVINLSATGGDTLTAADLTAQLVAGGITTAAGLTTLWAGKTAAYLTAQYSDPYDSSPPPGILRTNRATDPRGTSTAIPATGRTGLTPRWFGGAPGAGTQQSVTAADGPLPELNRYVRKTWTVAPVSTGTGDVGWQHTNSYGTGVSVTGHPVVGGTLYTISCYLRASVSMAAGGGWAVRLVFHNAAGTQVATTGGVATGTLPAGQWVRLSTTALAPATAAFLEAITSNNGNIAPLIVPGVTLDATGLLIEAASTLGAYFDGATPDTYTRDYAWTGTANASTSTESAIDAGLSTSRRLDVHLRLREVDYVAGTMRLELTSDEMYLQDLARYDTSTSTWTPPATNSLRALVSWALGLFGWTLQPDGTDATIDASKVIWNLGETLWSFLDAYIRGSGKRLWSDEARRWYLTDSTPTAAGVATITALTTCTDTLSRADEAYGDAAVMAYEWTDPTGIAHRDYAYTYTTGLVTPKTVVQRFTDQQPAPGAVGVGVSRLRTRAMSRGRAIRARAVSSYAVTPGQQALITTPVTTITGALVSAVTWNLPEDEMDVATRDVVT